MYILLKTSFTLLVPTVVSLCMKQYSIATASFACFLTSIGNHRIHGQNNVIKCIDIIIQHGFGTYFTIKALYVAVATNNYIIVLPSAISISLVAVYWRIIHYIPCTSSQLYKHAIMHIVGSLGICIYSFMFASYQ